MRIEKGCIMTDSERAELWKQLKTQEADAYERAAIATGDERYTALGEICEIQSRLRNLQEAKSIRALLAKIESIGEP